jgi:glycosyltransferase involved in cell wall biosynthesis
MIRKLVFINQTLGLGGAEIFNVDLLGWFRQHSVKIVAYSTNADFLSMLQAKNIYTKKIPVVIDIIGDWKGLLKGIVLSPLGIAYYGWLVFKHQNADVIFMTGYIEKILVTPWAKFLQVPVVWLEFAPIGPIFEKFFGLPKFLYQLVCDMPYKIIFPSRNSLNFFYTHLGVVIPLAREIDLGHYSPQVAKGQVYCVSRLEKGKGQDLLLKSWSSVAKSHPQAHLYIVGTGALLLPLRRLAKKLKIDKSVTFVGFLPNHQVLERIYKAQICVFQSAWSLEDFGIVAIEAMAMKKPIIGFGVGPLSEIVTPNCGILVNNSSEMARAINVLLKDERRSHELGVEGRKRYLSHYTFAKIGPKYAEIFAGANLST